MEDPDDPSVKASRYVALGLLAGTWAASLPTVAAGRQGRRELAQSIWISRHHSAGQALGTLRTWGGWSAWPESDAVPKNALHIRTRTSQVRLPGQVTLERQT
jgi:hypothetical protein